MNDRFRNANAALDYLKGKGVDTNVGRVLLASDVEKAIELIRDDRIEEAITPQPKTMAQAKRLVRLDEDIMANFKKPGVQEPGRSIEAGPDSSSRT